MNAIALQADKATLNFKFILVLLEFNILKQH